MLASLNRAMVDVFRRPRVAIVATGDELVDIFGDERKSSVSGAPHGDAVGNGGLGRDGDGMAGFARAKH